MKKIILILILLFSTLSFSQKPTVQVVKHRNVTTVERDAYVVPVGEQWKIFNSTTNQFEYWDGTNWIPFITENTVIIPASEQLDVNVIHVSNLQFQVIANRFPVGNTWYTSTSSLVTLDPADATNDRIDIFIAKTDGTVDKITGIASANPLEPNYDSATVYPIRFILIQAGTGSSPPVGYTNELIFDEDLGEPNEWTFVPSATAVIDNSDFSTGTKSIVTTEAREIIFDNNVSISTSILSGLTFDVKFLSNANKNLLEIELYRNTPFEKVWKTALPFLSSNPNSIDWQSVSINLELYNIPIADFDRLQIRTSSNFPIGLGYKIDNVKFYYNTTIISIGNGNHVTNTSQLINDGEDGINQFLNAKTIIPKLQATPPTTPSLGQQYADLSGNWFTWDGTVWNQDGIGGGGTIETVELSKTTYDAIVTPDPLKNYFISDYPVANTGFIGLEVVGFGDSISSTSIPDNWTTTFSQILGVNFTNRASGGQKISWRSGTVDGGSFTDGIGSDNNVLWNAIKLWEATTPTTPDAIIIAEGTNDISQASPLGTYSDAFAQSEVTTSQQTMAGALRKALQYLILNYPNTQIFYGTPIQSKTGGRNFTNLKLVSDINKEICEHLNVKVIDAFKLSKIIDENEGVGVAGRYLYDGTHTNAKGAQILGEMYAKEFQKLYY